MAAPEFFKRRPKEGRPLALRGLADGLYRLAYAWQNLTVQNGYVQWLGFAPKIVMEEGGSGGADLPEPGEQYQVLQLDENEEPVWDWVRWP